MICYACIVNDLLILFVRKSMRSSIVGIMALFILMLILPSSVNAQSDSLRDGVARCAATSGQLARLACYDRVAESAGLIISAETSQSTSSKWIVTKKTNPLDDSTTVNLRNNSTEGQSAFGRPITLVIRCLSNTTELIIVWNNYLGSEAHVLSRVGSNDTKSRRWSLSTDSRATFYPRNSITFLKSLFEVDTFVAQVTPYNESPITAVWDISGLSSAIEPLRSTCNW